MRDVLPFPGPDVSAPFSVFSPAFLLTGTDAALSLKAADVTCWASRWSKAKAAMTWRTAVPWFACPPPAPCEASTWRYSNGLPPLSANG